MKFIIFLKYYLNPQNSQLSFYGVFVTLKFVFIFNKYFMILLMKSDFKVSTKEVNPEYLFDFQIYSPNLILTLS